MRDMDQFSPAGESGTAEGLAAGEGGKTDESVRPPDAPDGDRSGPAAVGGGQHSGTGQAWAALGGDPALLARVSRKAGAVPLPSALPVGELATSTVTACSLAAAEFSCVRARSALLPPVHVDDGAVGAAFLGDRLVRIDGRPPVTFAPLSRYWRTADGWVRTHANYPHHRSRLLATLGITDTGPSGDEAAAARLAAELAERRSGEVEATVFAEGGLAVAVRTPDQWAAHPQRAAVAVAPLIATDRLDAAPPLPLDGPPGPGGLQGLRVLDLTRVIAGPVATRTLALLGADVLRIDAPERPEFVDTHADSDLGKRSTLLDLSTRTGQAAFEELLSSAHVVVTGYRPGALDRFGLAPESLADRRPGLVVGQLSAWGTTGPWQRRRGFDSLVQAATGISVIEAEAMAQAGAETAAVGPEAAVGTPGKSTGTPPEAPRSPLAEQYGAHAADRTPRALPAQALDHGTGYLLAAALLRALTEQRAGTAGSRLVRLSLARTAHWLLHEVPAAAGPGSVADHEPGPAGEFDPSPWLTETDSPLGRLRYVLPAVGFGPVGSGDQDGARSPADWSRVTGAVGGDKAVWQ
ncbi:CoA transferase [Streptomyces iconiensis]|uniref:CoA transferase n=1 Tax=Streptomyces iconiensis TaxID=1384038 RepID=A0ABT6ZPQ9_9ACTN|nr:CoA transferase [Streptomyces iconiensis]MDJ1131047.1 CoA transferase [Streptomyces iconiensis]